MKTSPIRGAAKKKNECPNCFETAGLQQYGSRSACACEVSEPAMNKRHSVYFRRKSTQLFELHHEESTQLPADEHTRTHTLAQQLEERAKARKAPLRRVRLLLVLLITTFLVYCTNTYYSCAQLSHYRAAANSTTKAAAATAAARAGIYRFLCNSCRGGCFTFLLHASSWLLLLCLIVFGRGAPMQSQTRNKR